MTRSSRPRPAPLLATLALMAALAVASAARGPLRAPRADGSARALLGNRDAAAQNATVLSATDQAATAAGTAATAAANSNVAAAANVNANVPLANANSADAQPAAAAADAQPTAATAQSGGGDGGVKASAITLNDLIYRAGDPVPAQAGAKDATSACGLKCWVQRRMYARKKRSWRAWTYYVMS